MSMIKNRRGFTIIEVLIVLAVASLIILAIFLIVPNARRGRDDLSRKNAAGQLQASLDTYGNEHAHDYSGFSCATYCKEIYDPDSPTGHPNPGTVGTSATQKSGVVYVIGAACGSGSDAGSSVTGSNAGNSFAVLYWSEGTNTSHCMDSTGQSIAGAGTSGTGADGSSIASGWTEDGGGYSLCSPSADRCLAYSGGAAYTAWSPTTFTYNFSNIASGTNTITINYKNTGPLPSSYSAFNVNIYINGVKVLQNQSLPVTTAGSEPEPYVISINMPANATTIGVEWTNDWCCQSGMDANFVLNNLRVGR